MPFTAKDTNGNTVTIQNGDRVSLIGTRSADLYVTDIVPIGEGMHHRARVLFPVPCSVAPFTGLNGVTFNPEYGTAVTIQGQPEPKKVNHWMANRGPNNPDRNEHLVFNEQDQASYYGAFRLQLEDAWDGLMIADQYTVELVTMPAPTGGDPDIGLPGITGAPVATALTVKMVSLTDQYEFNGSIRILRGNGKLQVNAQDIPAIEAADYIKVTMPNGVEVKYTLWDKSVEYEQTYHGCVYLKRLP